MKYKIMIERIIKKRAKRSLIWQIPLNELKELVKNSNTIGSILKAFGLQNQIAGGSTRTALQTIIRDKL